MTAKKTVASASSVGSSVHEPFEQAYETYVKALDDVCQRAQRQWRDHHLEFQTRAMRLNMASSQDEFKAAQDGVHEMMAAAPAPDSEMGRTIDDGFAQYKAAIQSALRDADLAALDPATLYAIGQSFSMAANFAQQAALYASHGKK